jgi:hypothetical protein
MIRCVALLMGGGIEVGNKEVAFNANDGSDES